METGYRITEAARRSGFNTSTLRYYEDVGVMPAPARTESGYRIYDDRAIARLRFIARAKHLGCTLEEIADLLHAWDDDRCVPVAERLGALVKAKQAATNARIAELMLLANELRRVATIVAHAEDDVCHDDCVCMTAPEPEPPIACSLDAGEMPRRVDDWNLILASATAREPIDGGVRLTFGASVDVAELARLAAAEQHCCGFFAFTLSVDPHGIALDVRAPDSAQQVVTALFGAVA